MQRRIRDITERIDDRRSVHPEGDKHAEEVRQIAVFGRERRDDQSETQGEALNQEYEHREKEQVPVGVQIHTFEDKEEIDDDEGRELQRETKHLRDNYRDRRYESREVDLTEEIGVRLEGSGNRSQAFGEVFPKADTTEVEDRLRDVVGRYFCNASEHDDIHEHREQGRDEIPAHAEDSLLELDCYIAFDKQPNQIFLLP